MYQGAFKKLREEFPVLRKYAYLNTAAYGLLPLRAIKRLQEAVVKFCSEGPVDSSLENKVLLEARNEISKLINCKPEEIAFTTSTTTGLKAALRMIRLKPGDNVVSFDLEFPGLAATVKSLCDRVGCRVNIVKHRNGFYELSDIRRAVNEKTKAIVASSVQWVNGLKMDLKALREIADSVGAYLILDSIQHVGGILFDVNEAKPDFVAVGGEKWLMATWMGVGFLYVRKQLVNEFELPPYGLLNLREPKGGWSSYWPRLRKNPWKLLPVRKTAEKYEWGGTPPVFPLLAFYGSLKMLNEIGMGNVHERNIRLKEYLVEKLFEIGAKIISFKENKEEWSSITTFRLHKSLERDRLLVERLRGRGIIVSTRGVSGIGGIRVSPHFYNDVADIDRLLCEISRVL